METLFSKIISGEIPSYKVAENNLCFAFLDINPNNRGHVLCVPKKIVDKLFDLPEKEYLELMSFSRRVALAIKKVIPCNRVAMSVIGLEVPHAHVHLIPLNEMDDIRFNKKVSISPEEMKEIAVSISSYFKS
ncbi:MAG: HIT family protein [Flavobacteriaceae bacterium]